MVRPTAVEPRDGYRIWLRYSDGAAGEGDLSHLAGRGVFEAWNDRACFEAVHMTEYDAVAWSQELELCPDVLYMQLTGKALDDAGDDVVDRLDQGQSLDDWSVEVVKSYAEACALSFQPALEGALAFSRWAARDQPFDTEVLVQV